MTTTTTTTSCDENFSSSSELYNDYYKAIKRDNDSSSQLNYIINHHQTPPHTINNMNIPSVDSNASAQPTTSTAPVVPPKPMVTFKKQKLQKHRHGMLRHNQKQSEPSTQTTAKCELNCHLKHCNSTTTATSAATTQRNHNNGEILAMTTPSVNDTTNNDAVNMCQYHARLFESNRHYLYQKYQQNNLNQLHRQEKDGLQLRQYDDEHWRTQEKDFNVEMVRDLRWIHWRMTLFMFYWIVWFIFLIGVIIIVALRAKS